VNINYKEIDFFLNFLWIF